MLKDFILTHPISIANYPEKPMLWKYTHNNSELVVISKARKLSSSFNDIVDTIPHSLYRKDVSLLYNIEGLSYQKQKDMLYKAFIATILWGGKHSSNPNENRYFSELVKEDKDNISSKILDVYNILTSSNKSDVDKIKDAYNSFQDDKRNKIRGLGDAYFTKILYFMTKEMKLSPQPLILDSWMKAIHYDLLYDDGRKQTKFYKWSGGDVPKTMPDAYVDYCSRLELLANKIDTTSDQLELYLYNNIRPVSMAINWTVVKQIENGPVQTADMARSHSICKNDEKENNNQIPPIIANRYGYDILLEEDVLLNGIPTALFVSYIGEDKVYFCELYLKTKKKVDINTLSDVISLTQSVNLDNKYYWSKRNLYRKYVKFETGIVGYNKAKKIMNEISEYLHKLNN